MSSQLQQELVSANEKYASTFKDGDLALPPSKKYLVVTCMDARIDTAAAFGIPLGAAHTIRNAGGRADDALRSIILSQQLLGTEEIFLVKHTGCGMLTFKNDDAYAVIDKSLGGGKGSKLKEENFDFGPFPDLEQAVQDDVQYLKGNEYVNTQKISGWIFDVKTGKVSKVA